MSASKAYKPAHGGYPSTVQQRQRWKVVYCDQFGIPDKGWKGAYAESEKFGANSEGVFDNYSFVVEYLRFRRNLDSLPGVYFTIVEVCP